MTADGSLCRHKAVVESQLDRVITLLRNKMHSQRWTQRAIQAELNWGRTYISQLLTKQKLIRLDQVLLILEVIGIPPGEFFTELYSDYVPPEPTRVGVVQGDDEWSTPADIPVKATFALFMGLLDLLIEKDVCTSNEVVAATRAAAAGQGMNMDDAEVLISSLADPQRRVR